VQVSFGLYIGNNKIKSMPQFPALVQVIDLSSNMIQKI
jgi:hypothetical protein